MSRWGELELGGFAVEIWLADLDHLPEGPDILAERLSDSEKTKAARMTYEPEKSRFVACRAWLRTVLAHYSGCEPPDVKLGYGLTGKPLLEEAGLDVRFSVSHSRGQAIYAVTHGREVGVDLEHLRPLSEIDGLVSRFLSVSERGPVERLPVGRRTEAFFRYWTAKEACLKAIGLSVAALPMRDIEIAFEKGGARILRIKGDRLEASRWLLKPLEIRGGLSAAIVVENLPSRRPSD